MNWFDTAAYAAEAGATSGPGYMDLLLLGGFVAIFYFLLWRPQSKRRKEHQGLMGGLAKGDEVVAQITKVEEDFVKLKIAPNMEVRLQKSAVGATLPKGTLKSLEES